MSEMKVIDYLSDGSDKQAIESLETFGFLVLNNIPLSNERVELCYNKWHDFFLSDDKYNYLYSTDSHDGFRPIDQAETAKNKSIRDLKEMFHYYPHGRCPDYLRVVTQQLFAELNTLASELLTWFEAGLPQSIRSDLNCSLSDMITDSPNTLYRLLHYPPLTGQESAGALRAAAHTDICLLTVLPAATAQGLQILTREGEWIDVPIKAGSIIVNVGDMLEECSQGYYLSTQHRVVNPEGQTGNQSRLSMPLFLHPRDEVVLSSNYTAVSYRIERLKELGLISSDK